MWKIHGKKRSVCTCNESGIPAAQENARRCHLGHLAHFSQHMELCGNVLAFVTSPFKNSKT